MVSSEYLRANPLDDSDREAVAQHLVAGAICHGLPLGVRRQRPVVRDALQTLALARGEAADLVGHVSNGLHLGARLDRVCVISLHADTVRTAGRVDSGRA